MGLQETLVAQLPPLSLDAGGVVRVAGTRVTLETVVNAYENGASCEEIAHNFDVLTLADVYAVISYYLAHHREVAEYMTEHRRLSQESREAAHARFPTHGLREQLEARQMQKP